MNLGKKKNLAARALNISKKRIVFLKSRIDEIKEAITKQDIRDLKKSGAIIIKDITGKRKGVKIKNRGFGNIRKKVKRRKQNYIIITRKLRKFTSEMGKQGKLSRNEIKEIRKKIRNKTFKSKMHLGEYINNAKREGK